MGDNYYCMYIHKLIIKVALLSLLDLSAAFDTVDHSILLDRLHVAFGIGGAALGCIRTFLTARTQQVLYLGSLSSVGQLAFGVPQGSVLGPLLYVLYTAGLFEIIESCGLTAHSYADDTQVYLSVPASDAPLAVNRLTDCIDKIEHWMGCNRLRLNVDKTQVLWMGTRQQLEKIRIDELILHSSTIQFSKKLGQSVASISWKCPNKYPRCVVLMFLPAASNSDNPAVLDVRFNKDTRECHR